VTPNYTRFIAILIVATAFAVEPVMATVAVKPDTAKAHLPRVPRAKLLRSNPHRFTAIRLQGTDPYDAPDDDFLYAGSVRKTKVADPKPVDDDGELSDYVTVRLAVARARAMQRYREIRA
jgi:hypothetical protein